MSTEENQTEPLEVKPARDHFPLSIVWCPIPGLTWLLPFIGHLGVVTSDGTIHDFAGPYYVNRHPHKMGFGSVTRYYPVKSKDIKSKSSSAEETYKQWDAAVEDSSDNYDKMMHDLFCNNCHSHVAQALNDVEFQGFKHWNTFFLIFFMLFQGRYVSFARFLQTYAGSLVLLTIILVVYFFTKS